MSRKRKSRPDPQRPGYDRAYSTSFRDSDSWDWPGGGPGPDSEPAEGGSGNGAAGDAGGWTDAIGDGVRMGYRVIEDQIRQGQRVAEQINDRFYQAGPAGLGAPDLTQRMWRSYWDLAAMWWDFMGSFAGGPGVRQQTPPWGNGSYSGGYDNGGYTGGESQPELSIEVDSKRATRVGVVLNGVHGCRSLVSLTLHGPADEPLGGEVEIAPIVEGEAVRVAIRVPDDQTPGTYTGRLVDGTTGARLGTLTVYVE